LFVKDGAIRDALGTQIFWHIGEQEELSISLDRIFFAYKSHKNIASTAPFLWLLWCAW